MHEYVHSLGLKLSDVRCDQKGRLFILVEGKEQDGGYFYKEIELPEEFQTIWNVDIIKDNYIKP